MTEDTPTAEDREAAHELAVRLELCSWTAISLDKNPHNTECIALAEFRARARREEREACAEIAAESMSSGDGVVAERIRDDILSRGSR